MQSQLSNQILIRAQLTLPTLFATSTKNAAFMTNSMSGKTPKERHSPALKAILSQITPMTHINPLFIWQNG
jgi:hypothetical protein